MLSTYQALSLAVLRIAVFLNVRSISSKTQWVDDQVDNYVPQCSNVLWSELDKNLKDNNLSVLTVNARSITGKFEDLITN